MDKLKKNGNTLDKLGNGNTMAKLNQETHWPCLETQQKISTSLLRCLLTRLAVWRSWAGSQLPFFFLGITSLYTLEANQLVTTSLYTLEANQLVTTNGGVASSCAVKTSSGVGAFVARIFLLSWPK